MYLKVYIMDPEVQSVKTLLTSHFYHAQSEWIEGCVGYYKNTLEGQANSGPSLESFILTQWTLGDLREMGQGCLPSGLSSTLKAVLPKKYALQVESMLDIGQSSYTQMQKIRNVSTVNVDLTEKAALSWEPRLTRMIQLSLSDGFENVKAIEYRPIKSLNEHLLPGCKVLIIGPVECRRGVILLQEHNLKFLGGEIDSLLIPNALENILARNLKMEENPEPYKNASDLTISRDANLMVMNSGPTPVPPSCAQQFCDNTRVCVAQQLPQDDDMFEAEMDDQLRTLESQYDQERNNTGGQERTDFDEDLERHFAALEQQSDMHHVEANHCTLSQMMAPVFNNVSNDNPDKQISHKERKLNDVNSSYTLSKKVSLNKTSAVSSCKSDKSFINLLAEDDDILMNISVEDLESEVSNNERPPHPVAVSRYNQSKTTRQSLKEPPKSIASCSSITQKTQSKITSFLRSNIAPSANNNKERPESSSHLTAIPRNSQSKTFPSGTASKRPAPNLPVKKHLPPSLRDGFNYQPPSDNKEVSKQLHFHSNNHSKLSVPCNKIKDIQHSTNRENTSIPNHIPLLWQRQLKEPQSTLKKVMKPVLTSPHPFVYLSQVVDTEVDHCITYTVKAFIVTLLSRLTLKPEGWKLSAKLGDGSATLDVNFSSEVLELILGVTAAEVQSMKPEMPQNPLVKERVRTILLKAKQQLIDLNSLLDIKFSTHHTELPTVTNVTDISSEHLKALEMRLSSISALH